MANDIKVTNTEIIIDDGSRRVPIKNQFGDTIGVFQVRPTDVGIIERYNELVGTFDTITEPLENIGIEADGTAKDDEDVAALQEAERRLNTAVDKLFGGNVSEAFFGKMHPFSPIGGRFYCELAIEAVGSYINAVFSAETAAMQRRVAKFTDGYESGKRGRKK